jgi:hypothetical protein
MDELEMVQQEEVAALTQHVPERTENTAINLNEDGSDRTEIQAEHTQNVCQKCHYLGQPAQ